MPKCPECGEEIGTLIAWIPKEDKAEVALNSDGTLSYMITDNIEGKGATEYECPMCGEIIFSSETDAKNFLKGEG